MASTAAASKGSVKSGTSIKVATPASPVALSETTRDNILMEILTSFAKTPRQDPAFVSQESHRIAKKFRVTNMQVAGIRANLARGTYGNMKYLVSKQRKALNLTATRTASR